MPNFAHAVAALLFTLAPCFVEVADAGNSAKEKSVDLTDEKSIDATIDFGLGDIFIFPGSSDKAVEIEGDYDDDMFEYKFEYDIHREVGRMLFDVSGNEGDWNRRHIDNEWRFGFTDKIPLDLDIDIGAASCEMRLGGLSVRNLRLDIGAADCTVRFDKINGCELEKILIDAGASSTTLKELGNARFDRLDFEGGVGSSDIDFTGQFDFDATADISVGMGSVDIIVPEHIGVRIYTDNGFLSSVDVPKRYFREVDDDFFESKNWKDAERHLEITIDVGMGSADIDVE